MKDIVDQQTQSPKTEEPKAGHNTRNKTKDYQQRVIEEKRELDEKLAKLDAFGRTELFAALPADEQGRLNRQHSLMEAYSAVLGERIANFTCERARYTFVSEDSWPCRITKS
jgi:hypothetical protein